MKHKFLTIVFSGISSVAVMAGTFPLDFSSSGYKAGPLNGQGSGSTLWKSSSEQTLFITEGAGMEGKAALVSAPSKSPERNDHSYVFPATEADLPGFDGNSSVVDYSFRFRFNAPPAGRKLYSNFIVNLGYDSSLRKSAVFIGFSHKGVVTYKSSDEGNKLQPVIDGNGKTLVINDTETWVEVNGQIDYKNQQWTLFVNGVQQGGKPLLFEAPSASCAIRLVNVFSKTEAYLPMVFDSFSLSIGKRE